MDAIIKLSRLHRDGFTFKRFAGNSIFKRHAATPLHARLDGIAERADLFDFHFTHITLHERPDARRRAG